MGILLRTQQPIEYTRPNSRYRRNAGNLIQSVIANRPASIASRRFFGRYTPRPYAPICLRRVRTLAAIGGAKIRPTAPTKQPNSDNIADPGFAWFYPENYGFIIARVKRTCSQG